MAMEAPIVIEREPWNPDYKKEILRRINLHRLIASDRLRIQAYKKFYANGVKGCIAFIEDCCYTVDPRQELKTMPFILFPKQKEFVDYILSCILDKEGGLTEKCRDMGATWLACAISVWLWLFIKDSSIGFGSSKEIKVDKIGDMDSIFEKVRTIIRYLPAWLIPDGFTARANLSYMKITNPENGAIIKGEAGDNIGRGGRSLIYFKDESAHYEHPEKIEAALSMNTDVQIDISSVNGSNNVFYHRRMAGEVWSPGCKLPKGKTRVFIFDWRDDPRKNQIWYDTKKAKFESEGLGYIFAQEVDRDYTGSVEGIIIKSEWARACIDAHIKLKDWGNWYSGEKIAMQDVADGGRDRNALGGRHGSVLIIGHHWSGEASDAARQAVPMCVDHGFNELYYDSIGVGTGFKVEINHMKQEPTWPKKLRVMPWNAAASPLNPEDNVIPGDPQSPTNEDTYLNLKAQAWFMLRSRVYKTYRAVTFGDKYRIDEMVSFDSKIPMIHQIIIELSQAVKKASANGKTFVDKKPEGAFSPNLADSIVGCYCPTRELSIFDVL